MSDDAFDARAYIKAAAPLLRLDLAAASLEVVKLHLETAERFATLVLEFPLEDESEPAPVFTP